MRLAYMYIILAALLYAPISMAKTLKLGKDYDGLAAHLQLSESQKTCVASSFRGVKRKARKAIVKYMNKRASFNVIGEKGTFSDKKKLEIFNLTITEYVNMQQVMIVIRGPSGGYTKADYYAVSDRAKLIKENITINCKATFTEDIAVVFADQESGVNGQP